MARQTESSNRTAAGVTGDMLDDSQKQFCAIEGGRIRLLAPAGSGKTLSLLWRCRALAERSGMTKPRFIVFTFTRAARDELRDRLRNDPALADVGPLVTVTTLNSWGFKLVKDITTNLKLIISSADRYFCIQNVLQPVWKKYPAITELMEDSRRKNRAGRELLDLVDFLKSMGFRHDMVPTVREFEEHLRYLQACGMQNQLELFAKRLADLELVEDKAVPPPVLFNAFVPFWRDTCDALVRAALFSLEDQKYWARVELEKQLAEGRFTTGSARCHHILVDEFQDINPLDLALLKAIAGVNKAELTIVGDDDQAIYEWRGATPEFILEPNTHIGGEYQTCILPTNYRSPRNIVEMSQRLIAHNHRRVPKDVKAAQTRDAHIEIRRHASIVEAITSTVDLVHSLLNDDACHNVALVSRKRSQIIPYQIVFAGQSIPFYAAEDLHVLLSEAFNELKEILAIRARAAMGDIPGADPVQDLLKLCDKVKRYPLSKKDREGLARHLYAEQPASLAAAALALFKYQGPLKGTNQGGRMSASFADAVSHLVAADTVADAIQAVSEHFDGLQKDYGKALDDIFYTDPPFLYLGEFAEAYGTDFTAFYRDIEKAIATLPRTSPDDDEDADKKGEASWKLPLHLMTALRAKGKEFDAVIVLDANSGIWPSKLAKTDNELEQERRLFYVATTRARRYLYYIVNDRIMKESVTATPYLAEMGLSIPTTLPEA